MAVCESIPDLIKIITEGLENTLAVGSIAVLSHPDNALHHWVGDYDKAVHLCERIETAPLIRDSKGTIETLRPVDATLPDICYIAAYPVITPLGPEDFVVAVAGTDSGEREAAWALLRALALEVTGELMTQANAPSIHAAIDDAPIGMCIASTLVPDTPLIYVNRGFERLTGYTRAEATGRNCRFLQDGFANGPQRRVIRESLAHGQGCTVEIENVRKDGSRFTNLLKLRPIYADDPKPTFYIGFQTDITAQRQAQHAKDAIIDVAPVAMLIVDPDGSIQRVNTQLEAMFGYTGEALIGRPVETLIPASLHARHRELRAAFQQAPSKRQMGPSRNLQALHKDGTEFPVEIGLSYYMEEGESYVIAAITDISHRQALENSLREKKEEAEDANRAQASFFANVSHELKTPLNAIIGFSEILKARQPGREIGPKEQGYAKDIHESAQHLLGIIEHILYSAKLSAGKWEINPHCLNIAELVRHAVRQIDMHAQEKGLDLRVDIQPDVPALWADERSVRQILTNLLSNATKYTPAGGRISVTVRAGSNREICICIADTGSGMDAVEKRRVLEPFGQAAESYSQRAGGIGLGLSIVQSLVDLHQGRLEIETEKDRGTTMCVIMPADRTCTNL